MTEEEALKILEGMPDEEWRLFFDSIPYRVRLSCEGGLVDWREVLPGWYLKKSGEVLRK